MFPEVGLMCEKSATVKMKGKGRGRGCGVILIIVVEGRRGCGEGSERKKRGSQCGLDRVKGEKGAGAGDGVWGRGKVGIPKDNGKSNLGGVERKEDRGRAGLGKGTHGRSKAGRLRLRLCCPL